MSRENSSRRSFFKMLAAAPLLSQIAARNLYAHAATAIGVDQGQKEASKYFVNMIELQRGVGRRLAELTGAESGIVTSGSAGAMAAATAGCMAGTDDHKIWQLPDTT